MFLIRRNASKLTRLRTYLSWKEVRRKSSNDLPPHYGLLPAGISSGDMDGIDEGDFANLASNDPKLKTSRLNVKIPWDLGNVLSEGCLPDNSSEDEGIPEETKDRELDEQSSKRLRASKTPRVILVQGTNADAFARLLITSLETCPAMSTRLMPKRGKHPSAT